MFIKLSGKKQLWLYHFFSKGIGDREMSGKQIKFYFQNNDF